MKKKLFFVKLLVLAVVFNANAQIGFEGMLHDYQNGSNLNDGFHSKNYTFVNYYNHDYDSWSGFAYSKTTDVTTPSISNQYSAIAGSGNNQSDNYLVSFVSPWDGADYIVLDTAMSLNGFYVTNNTYAYLSMRDGDSYAKKFGGDSGNDPDFFALTIKGYDNGDYSDSVNFYLADYRDTDNSNDYIINEWTFVDLSSLNTVDSLTFELSSTDNGDYGMNTPAYFCIDDLTDENDVEANFEEFDFDFYNGSDLAGGFTSGQGYFYNSYNLNWNSWAGFAYSRKTDVTTAGYTNQFSAITGQGQNLSETYAVGNGSPSVKFDNTFSVSSIWITNSTYAYLSMLNGDAFAKQFGGESGNDPDWFVLTIKGFNNGIYTDSVNFYMADFRFDDNTDDYIINEWTEIDLSQLGNVDSLNFSMNSSDVGDYGMNTPAYFCLDNIEVAPVSVIGISLNSNIRVYPNPVVDLLNVINADNSTINIYNLSGKLVYSKASYQNYMQIDLSNYICGVYFISVQYKNKVETYKIVKQ